jgi:pimeloyl-ACP methyl ester carboxylesterase
MIMRSLGAWLAAAVSLFAASAAFAVPVWQTLPEAAPMPAPTAAGRVPVNGVQIWYAQFGEGPPVILLHGGMVHSDFWGAQVAALSRNHRVIVIDSRGHGRSTRDARPLSYDLMTDDVVAVMDSLHLRRAAVVGWSDGGIIGLDMAMRHPTRITRLFAFGANADTADLDPAGFNNPIIPLIMARAAADYQRLSTTPNDFESFSAAVQAMWESQPHFTAADLGRVRIPVVIADGEHEELIRRSATEALARAIPHARLLILPGVSHFAAVQDPAQFNAAVAAFLDD